MPISETTGVPRGTPAPALVPTLGEVLADLDVAMREREVLNQRVTDLRNQVATIKSPYGRGDVLRRKGDRTDWVVLRVKHTLLADYAVEITTLARPKAGGFDLGKGSVNRGPVQLEQFKKTEHVNLDPNPP